MRHLNILCYFLVCILLLVGCKKNDTPVRQEHDDKKAVGQTSLVTGLVVSGHSERPPFDWKEENRLSGAGIEILDLIMGELEIQTDPQYKGPWKRVLENLEQGTIDVMCGLYETEERKQFALFTDPFSEDQVTIFVWHDRSFTFNTWDDLKGKVFGEVHGASRGAAFDEFRRTHATIYYTGDHKFNFKKLEAGRIDCIVTSYYLGLMYIKKLGYEGKIIPLEKPVGIKYLRYAFSKRSPYVEFIPHVNKKLAEMKKSGKIEQIIRKNLDYYVETYFKE